MNDIERKREELIVLRCQLRDSDAFRELVELMQGRLLYYVRRLVVDEATAYDVLQEVWIAVFRRIRRLREVKAFRSWIYRIAHDKAVSHIRHEISRTEVEEAFAQQNPSLAEESAWNCEDISRMHKFLERINPLHREVLTLHFLEEMKYEEIAVVVGCSVGTVKSRIHYAKNSLRRLMEEHDNDSK